MINLDAKTRSGDRVDLKVGPVFLSHLKRRSTGSRVLTSSPPRSGRTVTAIQILAAEWMLTHHRADYSIFNVSARAVRAERMSALISRKMTYLLRLHTRLNLRSRLSHVYAITTRSLGARFHCDPSLA